MKKVFACMLAIILFGLMTFNPSAAQAVAELTRYDTASLKDFSDIVTDQTIQEHKLLERRKSDEGDSLNTLAYYKEDGYSVAFVYPYDVKYIDKDGKIQDKSREIVKDGLFSTASYKTENNNILSYFSVNDDGNVEVKTTYESYSVVSVMERQGEAKKITAAKDDDGNLIYRNAVDTGIHLMYEAQYNGVKEYIVVDEKGTGGNVYTFRMTFDGLRPVLTESGAVRLLDSAGDTVLTIPEVYAKDSSESEKTTYDNTVTLTPIGKNTYEYTVTVDKVFLSANDTVYPVYIDPHVTVEFDAMEDAVVAENLPSWNSYNSTQLPIGYLDTEMSSRCYIYVRFNNLPTTISYHNILSAYYETHELTGRTDDLLVEVVPASAAWSETAITWNNQPYYHNDIMAKTYVGNERGNNTSGIHRFFISNLVRGWIQGLPNYGMVLKCSYNTGYLRLASREHVSKPPCLVIVYINDSDYPVESDLSIPNETNQFYIKNRRSGLYLTAESTTTSCNVYQADFAGSDNQKWTFQLLSTGYYKIKLANSHYGLSVYNGSTTPSGNTNGANIQTDISSTSNIQQWKFVRNWNGTYQILSKISYDTKGLTVYNASLADGANCILYTHNVNFSYNDDWTLEPVNLEYASFFSFTESYGYDSNTTSEMNHACNVALNIGCHYAVNNVNDSAEWGLYDLERSSLWYFRGHGARSCLIFKDSTGIYTGLEAAGTNPSQSYVSELENNSLRNLYLFGSNSCKSGSNCELDYPNSLDLIGLVYRKGAHFSFGTTLTSPTYQNSMWATYFWDCILDGKSYYDAIQEADTLVLDTEIATGTPTSIMQTMKTCSRHYAGDAQIVLYHAP